MLHITFSKYDCIILHKAYYLFTCTCVSINSFHSHSHIFNRLPIHIRNISACSIDRFKSQLDRYLRTIPDLPSQPGYNNSLDGGDGIQRWTLRDGLAAE